MPVMLFPARRFLFGFAILMSATCVFGPKASAQKPQGSETYVIKRLPKPGVVDKYKIKLVQKMTGADLNNGELNVVFRLALKETAKSVSRNGLVHYLEEYTSAEGEVNGAAMDIQSKTPKVSLSVDQTGHVEASNQGGEEPVASQFGDLVKLLIETRSAAAPQSAVKIGETWKLDVAAPGPDTTLKVSLTLTLDGIETIGASKAYRIKSISDSLGSAKGDSRMRSEGLIYIDVDSGKTVKMTTKGTGTVTGNAVTTEMTFELTGSSESSVKNEDPTAAGS